MSGKPLSHKANLSVSTTYKTNTPNLLYSSVVSSATKPLPASAFLTSPVHLDETLKDIKRRYEDEARHVQHNYEVDFHNHLSLVKNVEELEAALELERRRAFEFESKFNGVSMELDKEKRIRVDFEKEVTMLKEELRRADYVISEHELKIARQNQELVHLDSENKSLRIEIHRITDLLNARARDIEDSYIIQVKELTGDIDQLRICIDQQRDEYESRLRDLDREWKMRWGKIEDRLREKERVIAELDGENRQMADHISHMKISYEEEIRRQVVLTREEEQHKGTIAVKAVEAKLVNKEDERDLQVRKNQELVREVHLKERMIQEYRIQLEGESNRLKNEIDALRNSVSLANMGSEKLKGELIAKDNTISRLQSEIGSLERELQRLRDSHSSELNRVNQEHDNERRKYEDAERVLRERISELERMIRAFESDNGKLKTDLAQLKELVTGSVQKTIAQTFGDYDSRNKSLLV